MPTNRIRYARGRHRGGAEVQDQMARYAVTEPSECDKIARGENIEELLKLPYEG
jgi:hypothetical protein